MLGNRPYRPCWHWGRHCCYVSKLGTRNRRSVVALQLKLGIYRETFKDNCYDSRRYRYGRSSAQENWLRHTQLMRDIKQFSTQRIPHNTARL